MSQLRNAPGQFAFAIDTSGRGYKNIARLSPEIHLGRLRGNGAKLRAGEGEYAGADPEDADEYRAENVCWVTKEARWSELQANAKPPTIGKVVDDAMVAIARDNQRLKGVLPKDYVRPALDKHLVLDGKYTELYSP